MYVRDLSVRSHGKNGGLCLNGGTSGRHRGKVSAALWEIDSSGDVQGSFQTFSKAYSEPDIEVSGFRKRVSRWKSVYV